MNGQVLKELRKKEGLTQGDLAELLEVSKPSVASYETNRRTPSMKIFKRIVDLFDVSADYLLEDEVV